VLWNSGVAQASRNFTAEQRKQMDPGLQEILADGERYSSVDYVQAMVHRNAIGERMSLFHETYDLLLTPTMPILPFEAGREVPDGWPHKRWTSWARFSYPFNMTQQPALTVPCGFSKSGLPIGLQIIGAKYHDALVLRAGHAYQQAAPLTDRRPSLAA
jgi:aspartyl-tRNA(Asn)/glutamyl-tRNA(Gln) amidotransferase subunit A